MSRTKDLYEDRLREAMERLDAEFELQRRIKASPRPPTSGLEAGRNVSCSDTGVNVVYT
jgi:hypothetical protein